MARSGKNRDKPYILIYGLLELFGICLLALESILFFNCIYRNYFVNNFVRKASHIQRKLFPVPTAKARSGKNRDKPYYKEKALETCVNLISYQCMGDEGIAGVLSLIGVKVNT
jgi:hypothetical protein